MALQVRYIIEQDELDFRKYGGVTYRVTYYKEYYDNVTGEIKDRFGPLSPELSWSQLPQAMKDTLILLNQQRLAAMKTKLGTQAVYLFEPPEPETTEG